MRRVIIDTDLNFPSDDFQAVLLLVADARVDLVGASAAAGNTWMEEVWINLRATLDLIGKHDVPIELGVGWQRIAGRRPWAVECRAAGLTPFIGCFEKGPCPRRGSVEELLTERTAVSAGTVLSLLSAQHNEKIELLGIGPLSNISRSLRANPLSISTIESVTLMAGHFEATGNADRPDFNVWFDPDAASHVFGSGLPITLVPLDVCRRIGSDTELMREIDAIRGGLADFFGEDFKGMARQHGVHMTLCDQTAALVFLQPDLIDEFEVGIVHVDSSLTKGCGHTTFEKTPRGNVKLVRSIARRSCHESLLGYVQILSRLAPTDATGRWLRRIL